MNINIQINEASRGKDGLAQVVINVPDVELSYNLDLPFDNIFQRWGSPDDLSLDLLLIAGICYVTDKIVPRSLTDDFWTRDLEIEFPVTEPGKWHKAVQNLTQALNFLTGDIWQLSFRRREERLFQSPVPKIKRKPLPPRLEKVDAVCSLSGGVDSLIGAIDLLGNEAFEGIHLIGHYDAPGAKKPQQQLWGQLKIYYPDKAELMQVRVSHKPSKANEPTLRSRSFVFFAIGLYAARTAGGAVPLFMPENGFIALNIPLTPSRAGSCSTRTMHPFFLTKLREVLSDLDIENPLINPMELKTKGECVADCSNFDLLSSVINQTVSCSHGSRKQYWIRRGGEVKNCGYCVPCLIRRAALHKANLDAPEFYGLDVCAGEVDYVDAKDSVNDFRAMISAIRAKKTVNDFKNDIMAVASVNRLEERARMIERGFAEIKSLFLDKATRKVLHNIGLTSPIK
jgi:hypothetical protein